MRRFSFLLLFCSFTLSLKTPHPEVSSRRDTEHFGDDPKRHDVEFDHNAFLGQETAQEFAKLTPTESEQKLKEIIRKIDKNQDGEITENELKGWIDYVAKKNIQQSIARQWNDVNPENKSTITWLEYTERSYGPEAERLNDPATIDSYTVAIKHDKRRWNDADLNKDGTLNKVEFADFVHPEDKLHMRAAVIDELLDSVDKNHDGAVSETEYLSDLARAYQTPLTESGPEPDWVEREREQFRRYRDKNGDGKMDRDEVGEWIMPANYDPVDAETKHLIYHADVNKDGVLTEAEILKARDIFVSSQATNYGSVLEQHEEL